MIVVSSEIEELLGLCTRILVMREGELVAELDGAEATELDVLRHAMPGTQQMVTAGAPGVRRRRRGRLMATGTTDARDHRGLATRTAWPCRRPMRSCRSTPSSASSSRCSWSAPSSSPTPSPPPTTSGPSSPRPASSGVLAIGMTFVIATAGIDLSVGSIVAAAGVAGGLLDRLGRRGRSSSARSASGCCSARSTPSPSPSARSSPSSPRSPCWPSPAGLALQMSDKTPDQPPRLRRRALVRDRRDPRRAGLDRDLPGA